MASRALQWAAEGTVKGKAEYSVTRGYASVTGNMSVFRIRVGLSQTKVAPRKQFRP